MPVCHDMQYTSMGGKCYTAASGIKDGFKCWANMECESKKCDMKFPRWKAGTCVAKKLLDNLSLFEESQNGNTVFSTNSALIFVLLISFGCFVFFRYQKRESHQAKMENMRYEMQTEHLVVN